MQCRVIEIKWSIQKYNSRVNPNTRKKYSKQTTKDRLRENDQNKHCGGNGAKNDLFYFFFSKYEVVGLVKDAKARGGT